MGAFRIAPHLGDGVLSGLITCSGGRASGREPLDSSSPSTFPRCGLFLFRRVFSGPTTEREEEGAR